MLIDLGVVDRNIRHFHERVAAHSGVSVRSHVKGHRTVEIARRQLAAGAVGIALTQVSQARRYVAAGVTDVVIVHPWSEPWRWELIAELARECHLSVHVDSVTAVEGLAAAATKAGSVLGIRIQLGTGVDVTTTSEAQVLEMAGAVEAEPSLRLDGVTCYQALLSAGSGERRNEIGRDAAAFAVRNAELLRRSGLSCPVVAVGGTPTADGAMATAGVTEICAGAYALQDAGMASIGVCSRDDVAVSVVTDGAGDADALLDSHPYPWQQPGERQLLCGSDTLGGRLLPPHICALTAQIDSVTVYGQGEEQVIGRWNVLNQVDTAPVHAGTSAQGS
ncbi:alanine racemase [Streptomyces camelliae]|uniref:Alanine racemase n=1 Tax=Streptomyces camelliae TaxID=3004093 RepID=A0ABY7PA38_9ACTN|nr:alanine racemase [Streptomyces sp. HUAS 2-6]WBO65133.1 alanine racemase [Streptomyces sp. HUAS 2-6]